MNYKLFAASLAAGIIAGYYLARALNPEAVTQTEDHETIKHDVVTVIKEVTRPDGTKDSTTTIIDRSKEKKDIESSIIAAPAKAQNRASVSALSSNFREVESYTFSYERRLAGPLWVGAQYNTNQNYGLSLGLEF